MAQKYLIQITDDLDGTELDRDDANEVHFGLDDRSYVIDLSTTNATNLRDTLTRYTDVARRDQTATRTAASPQTTSGRKDLDQVRDWANANGHPVSNRGRIAKTILDAYDANH